MFTTLFDAIRTWFSVESLDHAIELVQRAAQIAEFDNNNRRTWVTTRLKAMGFSDHQAALLCELAVGALKPFPAANVEQQVAAEAQRQVTEGAGQPGTVTWPAGSEEQAPAAEAPAAEPDPVL